MDTDFIRDDDDDFDRGIEGLYSDAGTVVPDEYIVRTDARGLAARGPVWSVLIRSSREIVESGLLFAAAKKMAKKLNATG